MADRLAALHHSVDHLSALVAGLDADQLAGSAYPSEWSIADVLSHLGSGAVIFHRMVDDRLAGAETPDDFRQLVWDEWNAKAPAEQAADALVADRAFLDRLEGLTADERERFTFEMGPMTLDADGVIGMRLNEHALHVWDIAVALDPTATVEPMATQCVVDSLQMVAGFTSRPTGAERTTTVVTTEPRRGFTIVLGADAVTLEPTEPAEQPDLVLPAESFVRLVYGRLDPDHTPEVRDDEDVLGDLRRAYPGV
jgi:uncharacterized protein (TIGR03083 family)